jgi:flagellar hook-associated protein 3 FlgL
VQIRRLQEEIASGRRLLSPEEDAAGAAEVVRLNGSLAALAEHARSSGFGNDILSAQDHALADAREILVRAREIATQQASGLLGDDERAAAREEVHGLLEGLTAIANSELAGRRLFGGLALDAPAPFADPNSTGYTAATAYTGSTQEFSLRVGSSSTERVRLSTQGSDVFGGVPGTPHALEALEALETALAPGGTAADVRATLLDLEQGENTLEEERASVAARQEQLIAQGSRVSGVTLQEQGALSRVRDSDLATVITELTQAQTALQAMLATAGQLAQTSLVNLLKI